MTAKDKFAAEDWNRLIEAPMLAGFAVTAADPGGLIGAVQECAAIAGSLKSTMNNGDKGSLAHAIAEAYTTSEGRNAATDGIKALVRGKRPAEASQAAVARLGEIFALVKRTMPDQAAAFREFLITTATKTAEASKEGGFLGFGGEKISAAEHKTLADLNAALG